MLSGPKSTPPPYNEEIIDLCLDEIFETVDLASTCREAIGDALRRAFERVCESRKLSDHEEQSPA
jgi:hypothetical protein